ncbi:hypothetical protein SDJN03_06527, partial [Cucurbita argyrosperma subsp. sororia]
MVLTIWRASNIMTMHTLMAISPVADNGQATGSKKSRDSEVGWNVHGTSQEGHFYVSECPLGCTSSGRVLSDETMRNNKRMDKCPLNLQINSLKVDK